MCSCAHVKATTRCARITVVLVIGTGAAGVTHATSCHTAAARVQGLAAVQWHYSTNGESLSGGVKYFRIDSNSNLLTHLARGQCYRRSTRVHARRRYTLSQVVPLRSVAIPIATC